MRLFSQNRRGASLMALVVALSISGMVAFALITLVGNTTRELQRADQTATVASLHTLGMQMAMTRDFYKAYLDPAKNPGVADQMLQCMEGTGTNCQSFSEWQVLTVKRSGSDTVLDPAMTSEMRGCYSNTMGLSPTPLASESQNCSPDYPIYREVMFHMTCESDSSCEKMEVKVVTELQRFSNNTGTPLSRRENIIPIAFYSIVGRQVAGATSCAPGKYLESIDPMTGVLNCIDPAAAPLPLFASNFEVQGACGAGDFGISGTGDGTRVLCSNEIPVITNNPGSSSSSSSEDPGTVTGETTTDPTSGPENCPTFSVEKRVFSNPNEYLISVPAATSEISVKLWGAGGNDRSASAPGGWGSFVSATFIHDDSNPTYRLIVGSGGKENVNNTIGFGGISGGGGLTGIFKNPTPSRSILETDRNLAIAIAAGGGGRNQSGTSTPGQHADSASTSGGLSTMRGSPQASDRIGGGGGGGYEGGLRASNPESAYGGKSFVSTDVIANTLASYTTSVGIRGVNSSDPDYPSETRGVGTGFSGKGLAVMSLKICGNYNSCPAGCSIKANTYNPNGSPVCNRFITEVETYPVRREGKNVTASCGTNRKVSGSCSVGSHKSCDENSCSAQAVYSSNLNANDNWDTSSKPTYDCPNGYLFDRIVSDNGGCDMKRTFATGIQVDGKSEDDNPRNCRIQFRCYKPAECSVRCERDVQREEICPPVN